MTLYIGLFARIVIGLAFAISIIGKIRDFKSFEQAIARFQLLPSMLHRSAALAFIAGEMAVVVLLGVGNSVTPIGFILAVSLLVVFTTALASVLTRKIKTSCNCFGSSEKQVSSYDILRNLGFIACSIVGWVMFVETRSQLVSLGIIEIGLASLAAVIFVAIWLSLGDIIELLRHLA